ncbi:uncharacterized protein LOC106050487 isoform X1 [Biomphalaria glabrata]|uniref:tRNA-intron lyase n=1 Tax=Biomphalaria glabrata TaxID=6526 RepID=A0A9W2Z9Z2_BIOGL|nr:uncharacterized protein LOC106050487 isoform X1 [Biomphalaria glabrata]
MQHTQKNSYRKKRGTVTELPVSLSLMQNLSSSSWRYFTGTLDGASLVVSRSGDMDFLYKMGFFGKGTLSRSEPNFLERQHKVTIGLDPADKFIMSKRIYLLHKQCRQLSERTFDHLPAMSSNYHVAGDKQHCPPESTVPSEVFPKLTFILDQFSRVCNEHIASYVCVSTSGSQSQVHSSGVPVSGSVVVLDSDEEGVIESKEVCDRKKEDQHIDPVNISLNKLTADSESHLSTTTQETVNQLLCFPYKSTSSSFVVMPATFAYNTISQSKYTPAFLRFFSLDPIMHFDYSLDDSLLPTGFTIPKMNVHYQRIYPPVRLSTSFTSVTMLSQRYTQLPWAASSQDRKFGAKFKKTSEGLASKKLKTSLRSNTLDPKQRTHAAQTDLKCPSETQSPLETQFTLDINSHETQPEINRETYAECETQALPETQGDSRILATDSLAGPNDDVTGPADSLTCSTFNKSGDACEHISLDSSSDLEHSLSLQDEQTADHLVIGNSSDEENLYGENMWQPCLKKDPFPVKETLRLTLEETFFLSFGLGCLHVTDADQNLLNLTQMWQQFQQLKDQFIPHYVVYHYFRSQGWVPKSGLKFGCDFILYRDGPPFYHGSYSVQILSVKDKTMLARADGSLLNQHIHNWTELSGRNRVSDHVAKTLMLCYVIWPEDELSQEELMSPKCLVKFKVKEVLVSRWVASEERQAREDIP